MYSLYGIVVAQTYTYALHAKEDPWILKFTVAVVGYMILLILRGERCPLTPAILQHLRNYSYGPHATLYLSP